MVSNPISSLPMSCIDNGAYTQRGSRQAFCHPNALLILSDEVYKPTLFDSTYSTMYWNLGKHQQGSRDLWSRIMLFPSACHVHMPTRVASGLPHSQQTWWRKQYHRFGCKADENKTRSCGKSVGYSGQRVLSANKREAIILNAMTMATTSVPARQNIYLPE